MINKENILTAEGLKRIEEELCYLKSVKRREIADRIKQAIEFGDISENSEYDEAKKEQAFTEGRIITLEKKLRYAQIIDTSNVTNEKVCPGSKVTLKDLEFGDVFKYEIVGSAEADPMENRISNQSPVGKAIMGKKVGSVVEVEVPEGVIKYEIMEIEI
ncbi:MAG: transcription elongation factor GreA [Clostridia bacterium]|nr:transcription elongation factor GreA [Clostridia bacterium]